MVLLRQSTRLSLVQRPALALSHALIHFRFREIIHYSIKIHFLFQIMSIHICLETSAVHLQLNRAYQEKFRTPGRTSGKFLQIQLFDAAASVNCSNFFLCFFCNKRKASESSRVPVVCLERLKILVSRCPPQAHHSMTPPADTGLKCEGIVSLELDRELGAEVRSTNSATLGIMFKLHVDFCGFIKGGTW